MGTIVRQDKISFLGSPGRTKNPAGWTCLPWTAPEESCFLWRPPAWCWPIQRRRQTAAGYGCEHPGAHGRAHGTRREILGDPNEIVLHTKTRNEKQQQQQKLFTLNKKSQGESKVVSTNRHPFGCYAGNQCYSCDPKEQIHGAVLPVHQLDPWGVLPIIQAGMWTVHNKLLHHNTCHSQNNMQIRWRGNVAFCDVATASFTTLHLGYDVTNQHHIPAEGKWCLVFNLFFFSFLQTILSLLPFTFK